MPVTSKVKSPEDVQLLPGSVPPDTHSWDPSCLEWPKVPVGSCHHLLAMKSVSHWMTPAPCLEPLH